MTRISDDLHSSASDIFRRQYWQRLTILIPLRIESHPPLRANSGSPLNPSYTRDRIMQHAWFRKRWLVAGLLVVSLFPSIARAADPLVGKRVVVIKDQAPLAASGKEIGKAEECTVFTVTKVDGDWLWIASEKAYLRRGDVVPFEEAIPYYTRLLESNKTAGNYWNRAQIWRLKGELDIALGDMHDAIRLNSNESAWFIGRGILWGDKKGVRQSDRRLQRSDPARSC